MGRLANKVAIITGGAGDIGRTTAAAFLREGAQVMLVGRTRASLEAAVERLGGGPSLAFTVADIASEADTEAFFAATEARFGGVDIVFANAGNEGAIKPLAALTVEEFDTVITTNVRGTWLSIKHAVPCFAKRGGGAIVVNSSVAGITGVPGLAAYGTSKHALMGLVRVGALELAPSNIRINAVAPGPIENSMMRSLETKVAPGHEQAVHDGFAALSAMKRYGTNEEVANMVLFLASDEASYCTGNVFPVEGGFMAA